MKNSVIALLLAILVIGGGLVAYAAYQHDENTLDVSVGKDGIKVD